MAVGAARVDRPAVGAADAQSRALQAAAGDDAHECLQAALRPARHFWGFTFAIMFCSESDILILLA